MAFITKENVEQVQFWMMRQRFERFSRVRLLFIPILFGSLLTVLIGDHAVWRWAILLGFAASAPLQLLGRHWHAQRTQRPEGLRRVLFGGGSPILALLPMGLLFIATGGLDSPILPAVLATCFFAGVLAPARAALALSLGMATLVVLLTLISGFGLIPDLMPAIFGGGSHLPQPRMLLVGKALAYLVLLAWTVLAASTVRRISRQMLDEALDARDDVLRANEAHARELTVLSGELAHELKNPLANIKGLAVLASRDAQGRGVERLEVMKHEIARMEEILQEFLTFSRPLSPLSQEPVDLGRLSESVVSLYEGMAYTRNVTFSVSAPEPVSAVCDPRKVKQILINLVQNALEASPLSSSVELVLQRDAPDRARVEVRDRGHGLSDEAQAHLFEPGATSKERGTGLGLALARGLARQHRGDLTVENRTGGGCIATLVLPCGQEAERT